MNVDEFIKPGSIVLPVNYSHNGITPHGKIIADRIWLFMHHPDYLGAKKNLVMLGNYEPNTSWFTLKWKEEKNPFFHLGCYEGIENIPPCVDIDYYESVSKEPIDYIIVWCLNKQIMEHQYPKHLFRQMEGKYQHIFSSENQQVLLFERIDNE